MRQGRNGPVPRKPHAATVQPEKQEIPDDASEHWRAGFFGLPGMPDM
ncbi:hypothetical protein SAMN05421881_100132 [Nitrosomonas halophila]|uniref:Uncharacterized protein n=1 Tax=Nitrosomonas halophila TaxID=44576 RepID=A0A1H3BJ36_9PROT|nr:hypothetical protein SAMN05421881_100132 [Nitrosomonas halophila]